MSLLHLFAAILLFAAPVPTLAQALSDAILPGTTETPDPGVEWSAHIQPEIAHPGETVTVVFETPLNEGWHMYSLDSPVGVSLTFEPEDPGPGISWQEPLRQTTPTREFDPNFGADAFYFSERAEVRAAVQVSDSVTNGIHVLGGDIRYMTCNDDLCLPPRSQPIEVELEVRDGSPREAFGAPVWNDLVAPDQSGTFDSGTIAALSDAEPMAVGETASPGASVAPGGPASGAAMYATSSGGAAPGELWAFLLLAAGAGLGALLMPCSLPMIPLTVSYFTNQAEGRGGAARCASVYGITIVTGFTGLGALAAAVLGAAGAQTVAANPWINLFIGLMLVMFGLSLVGLFDLRLPGRWANAFHRRSDASNGYLGAVFMGLTLTVVSFSCTAPFVGALLAAAAQGSWTYPLLGMLVFSSVLAAPFVGFALFPERLEKLPSSGAWMGTLKVTFGLAELAAALKFLSNADLVWGLGIISRPMAIAFTIALFMLTALYLSGLIHLQDAGASAGIGPGRLTSAAVFLGISLYMLPGISGAPLGRIDAYFPPRQVTDPGQIAVAAGASREVPAWHTDDIEGALAASRETGRPIFVDFTGYTCTNCREMEANVFPAPAVAEHLHRDFVLLRLYTDDARTGSAMQEYQISKTGTVALPTYAVMTADEMILAQHSGMARPDEFDMFLEQALVRAEAASLAAGTAPGSTPSG